MRVKIHIAGFYITVLLGMCVLFVGISYQSAYTAPVCQGSLCPDYWNVRGFIHSKTFNKSDKGAVGSFNCATRSTLATSGQWATNCELGENNIAVKYKQTYRLNSTTGRAETNERLLVGSAQSFIYTIKFSNTAAYTRCREILYPGSSTAKVKSEIAVLQVGADKKIQGVRLEEKSGYREVARDARLVGCAYVTPRDFNVGIDIILLSPYYKTSSGRWAKKNLSALGIDPNWEGVRVEPESGISPSIKLSGCGISIKRVGGLGKWRFGPVSAGLSDDGCYFPDNFVQSKPSSEEVEENVPGFQIDSYVARRQGSHLPFGWSCGNGRVFFEIIKKIIDEADSVVSASEERTIKKLTKDFIDGGTEGVSNLTVSDNIRNFALLCADDLFGGYENDLLNIAIQSAGIAGFSIVPTILTKEYVRSGKELKVDVQVSNNNPRKKVSEKRDEEGNIVTQSYWLGDELWCEIRSKRAKQGNEGLLLKYFKVGDSKNGADGELQDNISDLTFSTPTHDETYSLTCWKCKGLTNEREKTRNATNIITHNEISNKLLCSTKGGNVSKGGDGFNRIGSRQISVKVLADRQLERAFYSTGASIKLNSAGKVVATPISGTTITEVSVNNTTLPETQIQTSGTTKIIKTTFLETNTFLNKNPLFTVQTKGNKDQRNRFPTSRRLCAPYQKLIKQSDGKLACSPPKLKPILSSSCEENTTQIRIVLKKEGTTKGSITLSEVVEPGLNGIVYSFSNDENVLINKYTISLSPGEYKVSSAVFQKVTFEVKKDGVKDSELITVKKADYTSGSTIPINSRVVLPFCGGTGPNGTDFCTETWNFIVSHCSS